MVQESVTKITSEIEGMAYTKRVRDYNLLPMLKKTTKPAPTYSFLDCNAQVLIQKEITEH